MTDVFVTLSWVSVGGEIWLAFVLGLVYRRVYREPFLRFWSLSFAVLGLALSLQLAFRSPSSPELITSYVPYLLGMPQFPLILLAALSLKPPVPSRRRQMLLVAGILAGLLVLFLVTTRMVADPLKLARSLRFERQGLSAVASAWFSIAFWRRHYLARTVGGRVTALFTALNALFNVVGGITDLGFPSYLSRYSIILALMTTIVPFGIASGMIVLALQALTATTKSLRDSEERYRTLVEASPDGIVACDLSGKILMCNRRAAELHGYADAAELIGEMAPLLVAPADREHVRVGTLATLKEGWPTCLECQILLRDGSERSAELTGAPLHAGDGAIAGAVTIVHDITERKEADRALRREREFSAHVIDAIPGVFFVLDRQGKYVRWNRNLENLMGLPAERIAQTDALVRFHPEDRQRVADAIDAAFASGSAETEARGFLGQSQEVRHFYLTGRRMELDGVAYMVGCGVDITERKRAEEEKAKLQAQLHHAQKMESIGRLAGGVAHDFNNLLTVINGYSQLLLGVLSAGDPLWASLAEIHKAGERAAGLTRQLLAFSRKQILEPRVLDLNRVVEGMRPMLERLVGEDVEVRVALSAERATVCADPHQLEQVLLNLVVNARDAMRGGGKLLIETARVERDESHAQSHPEGRAGRYVMLAVSDNGVGMDEQTRRKIFEPFFTTKEVGQGTGLGLSMVQGIVEQSDGYVDVYSEPGQGTTFKIYLPALAEAAADAGRPAAVPALGGKETVLVVEDLAEVRDYVAAVLKAYGYRVMQAENAGEALLLCERERGCIHLLLTDVVMPNLSGRELAHQLGKRWPGIKALFMSGYTDDAIVQHGVLEKGAEFIQKPFSPNQLAVKVREVLGQAQRGARILVAGDEAGVRNFLRKVLEDGGYQVMEAADGRQALKEALARRVDLVITDLVMPDQEGIETIQALRRDLPGVGIIAVSGAFEGQFLKTAELLGADAVVNKPVSAELLLTKVAEVLKPRR